MIVRLTRAQVLLVGVLIVALLLYALAGLLVAIELL